MDTESLDRDTGSLDRDTGSLDGDTGKGLPVSLSTTKSAKCEEPDMNYSLMV